MRYMIMIFCDQILPIILLSLKLNTLEIKGLYSYQFACCLLCFLVFTILEDYLYLIQCWFFLALPRYKYFFKDDDFKFHAYFHTLVGILICLFEIHCAYEVSLLRD